MINHIEGNLLESEEKYICHQCNCVSRKSAHLAYDIFKKFPYSNVYSHRIYPHKPLKGEEAGDIIIRGNGIDHRYVIALMGQQFPGSPKYPNSKLDGYLARKNYFHSCLDKISKIEELESIAFPWGIGCGAAGGNWDEYLNMIEEFSNCVSAKVFMYKLQP